MDVKGIKDLVNKLPDLPKTATPAPTAELGKAKQIQALASIKASGIVADSEVKIEKRKTSEYAASQARINQTISSLNVADEAAQEIDKLVKSVAGIVDQIDRPNLNEHRKQALSKEASDLTVEIKKQSNVNVSTIQESPESTSKVEIARKLEQTLKTLFAEGSQSAFGIEDLKLGQKENIIQVRTTVAVAKERVEQLRHQVSEAKKLVEANVVELEVAFQNNEASNVSVRAVEDAFKLASDAGKFIANQPEAATAANKVKPESLRLLD